MPNFIFAIVSIVYALVCMTSESDQGEFSTSKSLENKKRIKKEKNHDKEIDH